MTLNRFGRAAASWARCSMVMAMAVGCGSGSTLPSQSTDERLMAHEASLREDDPNPFVFSFDYQLASLYFVPDRASHHDTFAVPRHKAVALMLSQVNNDYPCPNPAFHPAPGQSLFDFLSEGLTEINDNVTVLDVTGEDT